MRACQKLVPPFLPPSPMHTKALMAAPKHRKGAFPRTAGTLGSQRAHSAQ